MRIAPHNDDETSVIGPRSILERRFWMDLGHRYAVTNSLSGNAFETIKCGNAVPRL
jgi:hypothetical protein